MKKINYLFALIATVFVLGMTSCDPNEVTPDNTVDGITLSDFDGNWSTTLITYNSQSYDEADACANTSPVKWGSMDLFVNSANSQITFTNNCDNGFNRTWGATLDSETLLLTIDSFDRKFQIVDHSELPNKFKLKVVDAASFTNGAVYTLEK